MAVKYFMQRLFIEVFLFNSSTAASVLQYMRYCHIFNVILLLYFPHSLFL